MAAEHNHSVVHSYSDYIINVVEPATTALHHPPPPHSIPFQLKLKLTCTAVLLDWTLQPDSTVVSRSELPLMGNSILMNFPSHEKLRQVIEEEMEKWPVWNDEEHKKLADFALMHAVAAVESMPESHNYVYLHIHVSATHKRLIEEITGESSIDVVDYGARGMVPASDSSIEALERRKIVILATDFEGSCVVCMEEFRVGCEAVWMPCEHVFHGDCIKKWLRVSHYCPICRFEMPTV